MQNIYEQRGFIISLEQFGYGIDGGFLHVKKGRETQTVAITSLELDMFKNTFKLEVEPVRQPNEEGK